MATAQQKASPGVYVTDDIGVEVTDGSASRVQLGLLPSGQYGLGVTGPNLNGEVSGAPPSIVLGTPGAQLTDNGLEVSDGTNIRVKLGKISATPTYGLKVVSSDGTTVIIDGTSDMFRIAATGTTSVTVLTNASGSSTVTLSGLGALASTPAHQSFVSDTNTTAGKQIIGIGVLAAVGYAAPSSGGSPTDFFYVPEAYARIATYLDGSSFCVVDYLMNNGTNGTLTWYGRYYVLAQVAL